MKDSRLLLFLEELVKRPPKKRGRKAKGIALKKYKRIDGKNILVEKFNKEGESIWKIENYDEVLAVDDTTLSHHTIKVHVNALVHLFFWQKVKNEVSKLNRNTLY